MQGVPERKRNKGGKGNENLRRGEEGEETRREKGEEGNGIVCVGRREGEWD